MRKLTPLASSTQYDNSDTLLASTESTLAAYGLGKRYDTDSGESSGT